MKTHTRTRKVMLRRDTIRALSVAELFNVAGGFRNTEQEACPFQNAAVQTLPDS